MKKEFKYVCDAGMYKADSFLGLMWEIFKHKTWHLFKHGKWMN